MIIATISKTRVTLRISGDDLKPDVVTTKLGCFPSKSQTRGEVISTPAGKKRTATFGMWRLHAEVQKPGDLDVQVSEVLERLTNDLDVWSELSKKYKIDLFCGIFMNEEMEGISVNPDSLLKLGERNILLDLDIYGPDE